MGVEYLRLIKSFLFLILFLSMNVYGVTYSYTIDQSSTTSGDGTWGSILKLDASLNGTNLTLKVSKQNGSAFNNTNTLYIKVGSYETYGVNRATLTINDGEYSKSHTHDLNSITIDYPKEFYARLENADGFAWVGAIKVHRHEPSVSSISPLNATLNEKTTFSVQGSYLPSTLAMWIPYCEDMQQLSSSSTKATFSCTPSHGYTGLQDAVVKDKEGGTVLKNFQVNVQDTSTPTPAVTSVSPLTANLNEQTIFTVKGTNLPSTLAMWIPYCENMTQTSVSSTQATFSCTPSYGYTGVQNSVIKDKPEGTLLKEFQVNILNANTPKISTITPTNAELDKEVSITVTGENFPSTLKMWIPYCADMRQTSISSTKATFSCTPSYGYTGVFESVIKDKPDGTTLRTFDFTVADNRPSHNLKVNVTDIGGASGQVASNIAGITNCREDNDGTCQGSFKENEVIITAYPDIDSKVEFDEAQCTKVENNSCYVAVYDNTEISVKFVPTSDELKLMVDSSESQKIHPNQPLKVDFKVTANKDDIIHAIEVDRNDGMPNEVITCQPTDFNIDDVISCDVTYPKVGEYTLTATAYEDQAKSIKSNMVRLFIEVTDEESKYTGHQNQENLRKFWVHNPTTAKDAVMIDTATGTQVMTLNFLAQKGQIDLDFSMSYNSGLAKDSERGLLGQGWNHNYGTLAKVERKDASTLKLHWSKDRNITFYKDNGDLYLSFNRRYGVLPNYYDKLYTTPTGYKLEKPDKSQYIFDSNGKLRKIINKHGEQLALKYDEHGQLKKVLEPISGIFIEYHYYDDGSLKLIKDLAGRKVDFEYSAGHLIKITDEENTIHTIDNNHSGEILSYTVSNEDGESYKFFENVYDDLGRVVKQIRNDGGVTTFSYDESEFDIITTTVTTPLNDTRIYRYNSKFQLLKYTDEMDITTSNKYTPSGLLRSTTDPYGLVTRYNYNDDGKEWLIEYPNGTSIEKWYYPENGELMAVRDATGYATLYQYDEHNRIKKIERNVQDNVKALITNTYTYSTKTIDNEEIPVLTAIDTLTAKNTRSKQTFTDGRLASSFTHEGVQTTYHYDTVGNLRETHLYDEDSVFAITQYKYDDKGRVIKATDPEGKITQKTYTVLGKPKTITDAKGYITKYTYNHQDNTVSVLDPAGGVTTSYYDRNDRLFKVKNANGHYQANISYDVKGRKSVIFDAYDKRVFKYRYDKRDQVVKLYHYDENGDFILVKENEYNIERKFTTSTSFFGQDPRSTTIRYDNKGREANITNSANELKEIKYENHFDSITSVSEYGETTSQTVDNDGILASLTDLSGDTTSFEHDSQKDKTLEKSPLDKEHKLKYNAQYLLEQFTNARGQNRKFTYYKNGWLHTVTEPNGDVSTFEYDNNGNLETIILPSKLTIKRTFDALNRVTSYTDQNGNELKYAYDNVGNLKELIYPYNKTVKYSYDNNNRLETVTDWNGVELVKYSYTRMGKLKSEKRANGSIRTYTYHNDIGELTKIEDMDSNGNTIVAYEYTYDIKGNIKTEVKTTDQGSNTFDYTYNDRGILQKVTLANAEALYSVNDLQIDYTTDNRIESINGVSVEYDDDGNMIEYLRGDKNSTLTFDAQSRLIEIDNVTHTYSIENAKIATTVNGKTTQFVVDLLGKLSRLLVEKKSDGEEIYHIYGIGLVASLYETEGLRYYHYDLRGSTIALTDSSGNITDRYKYLPYGALVYHKGATHTRFQYVGKYGIEKEASGLYYMRARYYDSSIKRFISKDSLIGSVSDGLSLNRYLYVNGNPINKVDVTGFDTTELTLEDRYYVANVPT